MSAGQNLRNARKYLRLSQSAVAEALGATRQAVAAFEKDQRKPDLAQLVGMANLYRLTLDELIGGAQSALTPTSRIPSVLPRLNKAKGLDDQDRRELQEFEKYLRLRRGPSSRAFERKPLEAVRDTVRRLRHDLGVEQLAPVPVFALIARLGLEIRFTVLGELAGALILPVDGCPAGILVNSDQPFERQRFSAGHELGHLILEHRAEGGGFVSFLGRRFEPEEVDADNFAAELLTPTDLLDEKLAEVSKREPEEAVYLLSRAFAVSFQAMTMRLAKLGALRPDQHVRLEKAKPSAIAKRVNADDADKLEFDPGWLPTIAKQSLPDGWHRQASPDTVRALQESAYLHYLTKVPEGKAADPAGVVYERAAKWVASEHPVVRN